MPKIMFLSVTGGSVGDFVFYPTYRIVEVTNEYELIGTIRARIVKQLIDGVADGKYPELQIPEMLRTLKVKLYNTGLTEYPATPEEEAALFRKFEEALAKESTLGRNPERLRLTEPRPEPVKPDTGGSDVPTLQEISG